MRTTILKAGFVVLFSGIMTTFAVSAFDFRSSISETLLGAVIFGAGADNDGCEANMVRVTGAGYDFCIDTYEVSADPACPYSYPVHREETQINISQGFCLPVSKYGVKPWRNITQTQAQAACAKVEKRLPTNDEWYRAALGTPDGTFTEEHQCNTNVNHNQPIALAGVAEECISSAGAFDMVGNVWEWVEGSVAYGVLGDTRLPETGYISEVDGDAISTNTDIQNPSELFGNDKFWVDYSIVAGMMRGGYFNSGDDAGVYALHAASKPSFSGDAVGFRCVSNL